MPKIKGSHTAMEDCAAEVLENIKNKRFINL